MAAELVAQCAVQAVRVFEKSNKIAQQFRGIGTKISKLQSENLEKKLWILLLLVVVMIVVGSREYRYRRVAGRSMSMR